MNLGQGLSAAGYAAGDLYAKGALMEAQNAAETDRAMRLAEFKATLDARTAEGARVAQVGRIDAQAGQLADQAVGAKGGLISANIADPSTWTSEQQAAVDQSLAIDRKAVAADPETRINAAIATGDIAPKDAAVIQRDQQKLSAAERQASRKELWDMAKEDRRDARFTEQQDRLDERQGKQLAAMFARLDRSDAKGNDKANTIQSTQVDGNGYLVGVYRDGSVKRMTDPEGKPVTSQSFEQRVDRTANALVKDGESKYRKMDPETLRKQVRQTLMRDDGAAPAPAPAPGAPATGKPAPAATPKPGPAVSALPSGSKQIGTSGGKPVYETPDGKRFIPN